MTHQHTEPISQRLCSLKQAIISKQFMKCFVCTSGRGVPQDLKSCWVCREQRWK